MTKKAKPDAPAEPVVSDPDVPDQTADLPQQFTSAALGRLTLMQTLRLLYEVAGFVLDKLPQRQATRGAPASQPEAQQIEAAREAAQKLLEQQQ